ncbi:hypothetical protein RJ639_005601 [Escallonia herrerae]|uniref:Uncharacterized protein n=1 Tax=Escallonia herrerae TaxID=1293975 RepID=A0AA89ATV2_9ASTE|nr:hypothetical protein RJ639_005601 [Escallonia herrerae]
MAEEGKGKIEKFNGMKNIQLDFCEGYVYGKQKRVSFRKDGKERKTERLKLVHTDVCGPTTVKYLGAAVDTAVYLINRSSASALNGGIPEEEWSGKPDGQLNLEKIEGNKNPTDMLTKASSVETTQLLDQSGSADVQ